VPTLIPVALYKLLRDLIDYDTAIAELKQKQEKLGEASGKG
jgi:hypothetical protein